MRAGVAGAVFGVCAVLLVLRAAHPGAQDASRPAFRVSTELVVVDLIASDRSRGFVADLEPSDLQVLEDGKPQKVEFVRLVRRSGGLPALRASASSAAGPAQVPLPASGGAGTVQAAADPVRIIIVVDLVGTPADEFVRVKDAIVTMLRDELPPGAEVMLATLWHGLTIEENFTADRQRMIAAVQALSTPLGDRVGFLQMIDTAQQLCETGMPPLPQLIGMGRTFIAENRQDLMNTSAALGALARASAVLSGRKHIVFYSRGYALNTVGHVIDVVSNAAATCGGGDPTAYRQRAAQELSGAADFDADAPLQSFIDDANRSQVSVYAIDPRGLQTTAPKARDAISTRGSRSGLASKLASLEATLPQEYLRVVAGDTGGRAFLNTNDLSQGLKRAWIDASEYYLVGYVPAAGRKKGRFHRIEVKTTRPGLELRFRRGYYDASEKDLLAADIAKALNMPAVFNASGLEIDITVDGRMLRVTAFITPKVISFSRKDDTNHASISVHAVLRDEKGKWVGGKELFGREIALRLKDEQLRSLLSSDNIEIPVEVTAPAPGQYQLTVVARDNGGWIGAQGTTLVVDR